MAVLGRLSAVSDSTSCYDWFKPDDFKVVADLLSVHPFRERIVIVGGQSLVGWALYFNIPIPQVETEYLTQDLDILCTADDGRWLARHLRSTFEAPSRDDHLICQTGKLTYTPGPGRGILVIDCLSSIIGPTDDEVRRLAVAMDFAGVQLNLLHPLLCLHSRLANLFELPHKRDGNGIAQALVAVQVARAFMRQMVVMAKDVRRVVRPAVDQILRLAASKEGVFCYQKWAIDPLAAITPGCFTGWQRCLGKRRMYVRLSTLLRRREFADAAAAMQGHRPRTERSADDYVSRGVQSLLRRWHPQGHRTFRGRHSSQLRLPHV